MKEFEFHKDDRKEAIMRRRDMVRRTQQSQNLSRKNEESERNKIQAKSNLEIGDPNDKYEQEADAVANKVVNGSNAGIKNNSVSTIHRSHEEEDKKENVLMAKSDDGGLKGTEQLQAKLDGSKGAGQSLDSVTQNEMGSKMGADLSGVKIHNNSNAHEMSEGINAKAFTYGQDIYFKQGNYDTGSTEGKKLLAHELTHTIQQGNGLQRKIQRQTIGDDDWNKAFGYMQELRKKGMPTFSADAGEKATLALKLKYENKIFLTSNDIMLIMKEMAWLNPCPAGAKFYLGLNLDKMNGADFYTTIKAFNITSDKLSTITGPAELQRYEKINSINYDELTDRFYKQYITNAPVEETFATLNALERNTDLLSVFGLIFNEKYKLQYKDILDLRMASQDPGKQEYAKQLVGGGTPYSATSVNAPGVIFPAPASSDESFQQIHAITYYLDNADAPSLYSLLTQINRNPAFSNDINIGFDTQARFWRCIDKPIEKEEKKLWKSFLEELIKIYPTLAWITMDIPRDLSTWIPPVTAPPNAVDILKNKFTQYKFEHPYYPKIESLAEEVKKSKLKPEEKNYVLHLLTEDSVLNKEDKAEVDKQTAEVVSYIQSQAIILAGKVRKIDPASNFFIALKDNYLKDYLANPTVEEGKKAVGETGETGIGKRMEGGNVGPIDPSHPTQFDPAKHDQITYDPRSAAPIMIYDPVTNTYRNLNPANARWEEGAIQSWNNQPLTTMDKIPKLGMFKGLKGLPKNLGAATDILRAENMAKLPLLDVPFLVGKENKDTSTGMADVMGGGKNISQLMHWASGVKYSSQGEKRLHILFFMYEMWHLEGWDVFGQDSINDLIAEEQGRLLGEELLKGPNGRIKDEASLLAFLNESFIQSRAWVGTLLSYRENEFNEWIGAEKQKRAPQHWNKMDREHLWASKTAYQMLADGMTIDAVKKSELINSQIEILALIEESKKYNGTIKLTKLEKALLKGKLRRMLAYSTKTEPGNVPVIKSANLGGAILDIGGGVFKTQ
jgi:hypothetical protein